MEPELSATLDKIVAGQCFKATELPIPTTAEQLAPGAPDEAGHLLELMEAAEEIGED
jgi:hypothetical protein